MTSHTTAFDIPAVEAWIRSATDALVPPFTWTQLPGGHSNLTFLIEDTRGTRAVIRRPPTGPLLPKAHDMGREWSIIRALGGTAVPVPRAIAFCDDTSVTGAAFYVMGHVAGATKTIRVGAGGIMLPNHAPLVIAEQFGTLAALYPGRIDLGLGRAPGTDPGTARALQLPRFGELIGDRDDVGRLASRVQREHRFVDDLVLGHVEVAALEQAGDIGDRVFRQQHAAQRALLGEQIVGRGALVAPGLDVVEGISDSQVCNRHSMPPSS